MTVSTKCESDCQHGVVEVGARARDCRTGVEGAAADSGAGRVYGDCRRASRLACAFCRGVSDIACDSRCFVAGQPPRRRARELHRARCSAAAASPYFWPYAART